MAESVVEWIVANFEEQVEDIMDDLYQGNTSIDEDEMLAKINEDQFDCTSDCLALVSCGNEEHLYMAMEYMNDSGMKMIEPSYLRYDAATVFNAYWRHFIDMAVDVGDWLEYKKLELKKFGVKRVVKVRRDENSSDEE